MMNKKQDFKMNKRNNFKNNKNSSGGGHHHPSAPKAISHHRKLMANFWTERLQRMICDGALATLLASTREVTIQQQQQQQQQQSKAEDGKGTEESNGSTGSETNKSVTTATSHGVINSLLLASTLNQALVSSHHQQQPHIKRFADKEVQTDPPYTRFSHSAYLPNQHWVKPANKNNKNFHHLNKQQLQILRPGVPKAATVYHTRPIRYGSMISDKEGSLHNITY